MLTLCTLLYVTATTGIGLVTSTFTSSQVAAVFVTAILTIVPDHPVLRAAAAGLDAGGRRAHRPDLAGHLLHDASAWAPTPRGSASPTSCGRRSSPLPDHRPVLLALSRGAAPEAGEASRAARRTSCGWAQGAPQPGARPVMLVLVVYAFTSPSTPRRRRLARGQQRVDRLRRRGPVAALRGALQRLLPAALQAAAFGSTQPRWTRAWTGALHVRAGHPARLRARPARRAATRRSR